MTFGLELIRGWGRVALGLWLRTLGFRFCRDLEEF